MTRDPGRVAPAAGRGAGAPALSDAVRAKARELGFGLVGITTPESTDHLTFFRRWLEDGRHGEMGYLARPDAVTRRGDLGATLPGVRSVVVVGHEYYQEDPPGVPDDPSRGVIARYARGRDYHKVVKKKLSALGAWLEAAAGGGASADGAAAAPVAWRAYVDTGPVLERDLGRRAGLGWFGKNTMLIHPKKGSYFFLGVLLTDAALTPDAPFEADRCGSCRACLDACPTGALLGRDESGAPVMDATWCISYLTIEHKGPIPAELRPLMGNRIYGCDICQEVCPFTNRFSVLSTEAAYSSRSELDGPPLLELAERLLSLSGKGFTRAFSGSPVLRPGRKGILRNVCVALGNWGSVDAVPMLREALSDSAPLVRGHAAWAMGRIGSAASMEALSVRLLGFEEDDWVREEVSVALGS